MHYVGFAPLAGAVSKAGALGTITALSCGSPDGLRAEIRKLRAITDNPFAVNLTLLPSLVPPDMGAYSDVVVQEGVPVIETAGHIKGLEPIFKKAKAAGVTIIHKCTAIRHAQTAERLGANFISIDGFECAGHPGESDIGNFVLLPLARAKLGIPFISSGGGATGVQLAAAMALGAQGISMGTRFMATAEAPIHDNVKNAIVKADENGTTLVMRSLRNTERVYKNKAALEVQRREAERPGDIDAIRDLVAGAVYRRVFQESGNVEDEGVWSAGVCMGLIDSVMPVQELVDSMVLEAVQAIEGTLVGALEPRV